MKPGNRLKKPLVKAAVWCGGIFWLALRTRRTERVDIGNRHKPREAGEGATHLINGDIRYPLLLETVDDISGIISIPLAFLRHVIPLRGALDIGTASSAPPNISAYERHPGIYSVQKLSDRPGICSVQKLSDRLLLSRRCRYSLMRGFAGRGTCDLLPNFPPVIS